MYLTNRLDIARTEWHRGEYVRVFVSHCEMCNIYHDFLKNCYTYICLRCFWRNNRVATSAQRRPPVDSLSISIRSASNSLRRRDFPEWRAKRFCKSSAPPICAAGGSINNHSNIRCFFFLKPFGVLHTVGGLYTFYTLNLCMRLCIEIYFIYISN